MSGTNAFQLMGVASVTEFGADVTGASDSSGAFGNAIASLTGGGIVWIPAGTYRLAVNISFGSASHVQIWRHPGATFTGPGTMPAAAGTNGYWDCADIAFLFDGGGSVLTVKTFGDLMVDFPCIIESCTVLGDQTGSVVLGIGKSTYGTYDTFTSIVASAPPTITTAKASQDSTLTGWTTAINAGDILRWSVTSATSITRATCSLRVRRG